MADTRLQDLYNPLVFNRLVQEAQIQKNAFIQSGVMANDATLASMASQGGTVGELTQYKPMDFSVENGSTDDLSIIATPEKVESQVMRYRRYDLNRTFSFSDLARMQNLQQGQDPVEAVTSRIGGYWANLEQSRVINSALGVLADNVANYSGDMVVSVATDAVGAVTDAERVSRDVILEAKSTLGDHMNNVSAIAIHSKVYTRMLKQDPTSFERVSDGSFTIETYNGMRVIVDDNLPAIAGTNRITYTGIVFGSGAFAYANVPMRSQSAMQREELAGNGSGQDILIYRNSGIIHPLGFTFTSNTLTLTGGQAGLADLELATNWDRVWQRKNVPMAFFQVND
ncbi:hypothetical protein [Francisella marina]|uniref:hypothetical protein n=1 Tax=Francisella marina TaxID=2249302 RepID=UPI0011ED5525|nr:hypothetical protein [Francisella marina]QEO58320.1 hypothetical protein F0R75_00485 [Francisella marina]